MRRPELCSDRWEFAAWAPRLGIGLLLAVSALVGCQGADPFYRHANLAGSSDGGGADNTVPDAARKKSDAASDRTAPDRTLIPFPDAGADSITDAAATMDSPATPNGETNDGGADDAGGSEVGCGPCTLGILYQCEGTAANTIRATFSLVNDTDQAVPLREVTIRYWFTAGPGRSPWQFACDNGMLGMPPDNIDVTPSVTNIFQLVVPARPGADSYFEVGFAPAAGDLLPGQYTLFRTRVFRQDYSTIAQTDDYSFNASNVAFAPSPHITLYRNGMLIEGVEPPAR